MYANKLRKGEPQMASTATVRAQYNPQKDPKCNYAHGKNFPIELCFLYCKINYQLSKAKLYVRANNWT